MQRDEYERRAMEHLGAVYRLALHLARRPDLAEELVQETYLRALRPRAVERFEDASADGSGMRAWLMTICHNAFYTHLRGQRRAPATAGEFATAASATEPDPAHDAPCWGLGDLDWERVDGSLKRAIEDLKPEFRAVLLLWGVEGLKYREIATILEVPIGTVMSRLHRARTLLERALREDPRACAALGLSPSENAEGGNEPAPARVDREDEP